MKKIHKMMKKISVLALFSAGLFFNSCANDSGSGDDDGGNLKPGSSSNPSNYVYSSRVKGLDEIFSTDSIGTTRLSVKRSEWNKMLEYYDLNPKNETYIHADYSFEKASHTWNIKDAGLRIRGNTSRCRPQRSLDEEYDPGMYQQSHFKVDFEEWPLIKDGVETEREEKMGGCMKGVILKRFKDDYTYSREIFGYNYFRECGIWTAPRAAYTRVLIDIVEDDGSVEKVDYGVYEMIESPDKQFLKGRTKDEKGGDFNGNKGNLWKCTWQSGNGPDLTTGYNDWDFGVETVDLDDTKSQRFSYDLKTNKDKLSGCASAFKKWINELNALDGNDVSALKNWFESQMDVDLFLKTYAVNVILGMWDDYWNNNNNYYFYFDKDGKAYFIPYDYDNILGTNGIWIDAANRNPVNWGPYDGRHPLIEKILKVPAYLEKYKKYLIEFSDSSSGFDYSKASAKIVKWQNMVRPYIAADKYSSCKLHFRDTSSIFQDVPASWGKPYIEYKILEDSDMNYFKVRQKIINNFVDTTVYKLTFNDPYNLVNFYSIHGETVPANELVLEFTKGQQLIDIVNDWNFSGENFETKEVCYGWCNPETGKIVGYSDKLYNSIQLNAVWKKQVCVELDPNGGNLDSKFGETLSMLFFEGEPIDGGGGMSQFFTRDGYILLGWTLTRDGEDLVTTVSEDLTKVYAKWGKFESVIPYKYDSEKARYIITFKTDDFRGLSDYTGDVYIRCSGSNWRDDEKYKMNKISDGVYQISLADLGGWCGFKFSTSQVEWIGTEMLKYSVPAEYTDGDTNFVIVELK